jgi:thiamine pyrophosphokinase
MEDYILFLNGKYSRKDVPFYRNLCKDRFTIAVDGGYAFFEQAKFAPNLLIGDLDSLVGGLEKIPTKTEVRQFPKEKEKTDAHLAIEYCVAKGAKHIDIVQPSIGEPDQFIGNIMLLTLEMLKKPRPRPILRIVNTAYEIRLLDNRTLEINGAAGDEVSIIPMSGRVVLTCRGTKYPTKGIPILRGETRGMRNRIVEPQAFFAISGQAYFVRYFLQRSEM